MLSKNLSFWDHIKELDPNYFNEKNQNLKLLCEMIEKEIDIKKINSISIVAVKTTRSE